MLLESLFTKSAAIQTVEVEVLDVTGGETGVTLSVTTQHTDQFQAALIKHHRDHPAMDYMVSPAVIGSLVVGWKGVDEEFSAPRAVELMEQASHIRMAVMNASTEHTKALFGKKKSGSKGGKAAKS